MRYLLGSAALFLVAATVACGSHSSSGQGTSEDPSTEDPNREAGADPAAAAGPLTPPPSDAPPPASDAGAGDAASGDAAAVATDAGPAVVNPECQAGSIQETESNDTAGTANAIPATSGTFCGTLSSGTDVDFLSFTLPANAKSLGFGLSYTQQGLVAEGTAGGQAFNIGGTPAWKPGQPYVIKVSSTGSGPVSYLVTVDIKQ